MKDELLRPWPDTDYRNWYLGDWLPPEGVDATHAESIDLVNNCFIMQCYDRMHAIAQILDRPGEAAGSGGRGPSEAPAARSASDPRLTGQGPRLSL